MRDGHADPLTSCNEGIRCSILLILVFAETEWHANDGGDPAASHTVTYNIGSTIIVQLQLFILTMAKGSMNWLGARDLVAKKVTSKT